MKKKKRLLELEPNDVVILINKECEMQLYIPTMDENDIVGDNVLVAFATMTLWNANTKCKRSIKIIDWLFHKIFNIRMRQIRKIGDEIKELGE
jgi:hypothetical protein